MPSTAPRRMPRIYLVRHGETAWSLSGQHTGKSDIPLTANGEKTIASLGLRITGPGKLLDPAHIQHAFISPRSRAQKTFQLLFQDSELPAHSTDEDCQEWDYGQMEGKTAADIRAEFKNPTWDIWTEGCVGGETPQEVSDRCDRMIKKIVDKCSFHHAGEANQGAGDILIVSHGHFTRCFLTRWCKLELDHGRIFVADAGAMSICGYQHHSFQERSLLGLNLFGEL
ncbi:hypothetical protein RQP46_009402 [Phenoliferia psychrophenolica]